MARARSAAARQMRNRLLVVVGLLAAFAALVALSLSLPKPDKDRVVVFAAASLTDVVAELERRFEAAYPDVDLMVNLGPSSVLARQIEQGAPADVFLSASPVWTDYLAERGALRYPARRLVGNRLVVVAEAGAAPLARPDDLFRVEGLALADEGVPAGDYAREALRRAGLWDELGPRVLPTRDVRAAVAAVQTGAVPVAIVYATDARVRGVRVILEWPDDLQPRIRYTVAVPRATRHANRALEFVEFIRDDERLRVWRRYGFTPLAEPVLR